jgi:hypothetical protein
MEADSSKDVTEVRCAVKRATEWNRDVRCAKIFGLLEGIEMEFKSQY